LPSFIHDLFKLLKLLKLHTHAPPDDRGQFSRIL